MLRVNGPEVYDQWLNHEIPFNDPKVVAALDEVGAFLKNEKYVNGGYGDVKSVASTTFQDGGLTILDGTCAMHRQATFYASQFPEGTTVAEDGDVFAFYLPAVDPATKPVLGGGEFITAYADRPEVVAAQEWLSTADYANQPGQEQHWHCQREPQRRSDAVHRPDQDRRGQPCRTRTAQFRFDASDLMPAAVGAGSFWTGMTDWITGKSTQETLDFIESSLADLLIRT